MIFINGKFFSALETTVLATDRGFLFGDGVFTTIRVANRQIEFFESHVERFSLHCNKMRIRAPEIDLIDILKLIELNHAHKGVWRLKIIATAKTRHAAANEMREVGSYIMLLEPQQESQKKSYNLWANPKPVETPFSAIKTLGCAARFFILDEAARHGCDDALQISSEGFVTEAAFANVFWRQGSDVFTPASDLPLMSGIALKHVKMATQSIDYNWHEVKAKEIPSDAQLFLCNSMIKIVPVTAYNHIVFSQDLSFENALQGTYHELILLNSVAY